MLKTTRISHPAFSGSHREATIHFYRDILGMEIVLQQGNLDVAEEDHFFFHAGEDNFIAYFLPKPGIDTGLSPAQSGSGWMDHLALDVERGSLDEWCETLRAADIEYDGPIDRGYERSIYFKDPNGVTIELLSWLTPLPEGGYRSRTPSGPRRQPVTPAARTSLKTKMCGRPLGNWASSANARARHLNQTVGTRPRSAPIQHRNGCDRLSSNG